MAYYTNLPRSQEKTIGVIKIKNETLRQEYYFTLNKTLNIVQRVERTMIKNYDNFPMTYCPSKHEYDDIEINIHENNLTGWRPIKRLILEYNKNKKYDCFKLVDTIKTTGLDKFSMEYYILNSHSEIRTKIKFINPYLKSTRLNTLSPGFFLTFAINGFELY